MCVRPRRQPYHTGHAHAPPSGSAPYQLYTWRRAPRFQACVQAQMRDVACTVAWRRVDVAVSAVGGRGGGIAESDLTCGGAQRGGQTRFVCDPKSRIHNFHFSMVCSVHDGC